MKTECIFTYCGLKININHYLHPRSDFTVIFNSGFSIIGFDEPIQVALRAALTKLDISWIQYTYPERTKENTVEDLYLSSGLLALQEVRRWTLEKSLSRIALFGISFGANIAIEHALANETEFLLLVNTVFDYREFREKQIGNDAFQNWERTGTISISYPHRAFPLGFRFIHEADSQKLEARAAKVLCPVYAFQGMSDSLISTSHVERLASLHSQWNAFLVPNADHAFDKPDAISFCVRAIEKLLPSLANHKNLT